MSESATLVIFLHRPDRVCGLGADRSEGAISRLAEGQLSR